MTTPIVVIDLQRDFLNKEDATERPFPEAPENVWALFDYHPEDFREPTEEEL